MALSRKTLSCAVSMRSAYLCFISTRTPRRLLHLHEYQSKQLMDQFGLYTQKFRVVEQTSQTEQAAASLNAAEIVVKAQILAGGRGKGHFTSGLKGGVHLTRNAKEVERLVEGMLGHRLVTHQTGPDGAVVSRVMLAEAKDLAKETYVAVLLDRRAGGAVLVVSPAGGMDIEQVAEQNPEAILKLPLGTLESDQLLLRAAHFLFPEQSVAIHTQVCDQLHKLVALFRSVDATMVEINPFGLTPEGEVLCFDAKLEFDENAAFRQSAIFNLAERDNALNGLNVEEQTARTCGLNYVKLDGSIGCLVNGAGLAMATMDLISLKGGRPANFLDVGGAATKEQIQTALSLLLQDRQVTAIVINIFGGIMRCDVIAAGVIAAAQSLGSAVFQAKPLIVRLSGTNATEGMQMLRNSGIEMTVCADADEAVQRAVDMCVVRS